MQWNQYLADAFTMLLLTIPACLVAAKLAYPKLPWTAILLATPVLSWIVGNAILWAYPPDNGFAGAVMLFTGWVYMLPILGVFSLVYLPLRRWSGSRGARAVAVGFSVLTLALPVVGCFRWIPESKAREVASYEIRKRGHSEFVIRGAERTWDGWILHVALPDQSDYPVYLSRSGFCSGMGG
ncbi:MAG: hypothetical protein WCL39_13575 [Armatimonadota bacterium]